MVKVVVKNGKRYDLLDGPGTTAMWKNPVVIDLYLGHKLGVQSLETGWPLDF